LRFFSRFFLLQSFLPSFFVSKCCFFVRSFFLDPPS